MKISKTRFINGINCPRFFPLFEIYKKKEKAVVSFEEDLSDLMTDENDQNKRRLLSMMYDETKDEETEETEIQDLISQTDAQLEMMMPYYQKVETLAARKVKSKFGGTIQHSLETHQQKRFSTEVSGYEFFCFLDAYQEDNHTIRIIESKATTSSKFLDKLSYKDQGQSYDFFIESPEGIYMTRESLNEQLHDKYFDRKKKLFDRLHDAGSYIYDVAYQRFVIENAGLGKKPIKYYLAVLNHEYVFDGVYDDKNEPVYHEDIIRLFDVTDLTKEMMVYFKTDVEIVIDRLDHMTYDPQNPGPLCPRKGKHRCMFHDICYQGVPKKNSVYTYIGSHHGFKDEIGDKHKPEDLLKMGIKSILDVPRDWLTRENNVVQYDVVSSKEVYIDKKQIKTILNHLTYPLYHLDFESFPCPLPRYKGEKPYSQSVFQFNLHIEHAPGICDFNADSHHYLAKDHNDQREALTKHLCASIGAIGHVIAYNDAFERSRMKELAGFFPEYASKLQDIIERTFDLWYVLNGRKHKQYESWGIKTGKLMNYYHEDLQGSFSIKKVLPLFAPSLNYAQLNHVHNGTDAMITYAQFPYMSNREFTEKYESLLAYCKLDTWAMVEILRGLRKITQ